MSSKQNKRNPGRPTEKKSVDTDSILRHALKAFAQYGFGGVSLNKIADETGVTDSNLHYHKTNSMHLAIMLWMSQ